MALTIQLTLNPSFISYCGSPKAVSIMTRLEHWFCLKTKGFYKFLEPCKHRAYKQGDSWIEELGFCRKTFNAAFDLIGIRYKSKSQFLAADDKFKEKLYASYYDRDTNQMFYVRNHDFVEQVLTSFPPTRKQEQPQSSPSTGDQFPVRTGKNFRYRGGIIGGNINIPSSKQKTTTSLEQISEIQNSEFAKMQKEAVEMEKIWKEEIGETGIKHLSKSLTQQLSGAFQNLFSQSLDQWKNYCRLISSSKFLMGEANNKRFLKAHLNWAIKEEVIDKIKAGEYGLGNRKTRYDKELEQKWRDYQDLKERKNEISKKKQALDCRVSQKMYQAAHQYIERMADQEVSHLQQRFDQKWALNPNSSQKSEYDRKDAYDSFLHKHALDKLGYLSFEEEYAKALEKSGLVQEEKQIEEELKAFDTSNFEIKMGKQSLHLQGSY